jgi:peptidoglycan/LPS O-acetylase OafA/YrhL
MVVLGTFSYSLYLIHGPLVLLVGAALAHYHTGAAASALAYGLLIPTVLALAYGFYRIAERPFLSVTFRAVIESERAAGGEELLSEPGYRSVLGAAGVTSAP